MKLLRRMILNSLAARSALLFIFTCVLWLRGYWKMDSVTRVRERVAEDRYEALAVDVDSQRGVICLADCYWSMAIAGKPEFARELMRSHFYVDVPPHKWTWKVGPSEYLGGWPSQETKMLGFRWRTLDDLDNFQFDRLPIAGQRIRHIKIREAVIPDWAAAALFALAPEFYVIRLWRSRRIIARGLCPSCGYDLRATPQRCPECGCVPRDLSCYNSLSGEGAWRHHRRVRSSDARLRRHRIWCCLLQ